MRYAELNEVLKNINASVVVYKVDHDFNISMEYFNDRFAEIYGGDKELLHEELKKDITFGVDEAYKQTVRDMFYRVVVTGEKGEASYRATTKGTQEIWVNIKATPVKRETYTLVYVTFFDVTAQIRAAEEARRNERYLQSACEFANIFTWVYEMDTKIIHMGKLLQEQIGLPERMDNFPECIFGLNMVNSDYVELYKEKIRELENGENKVEFEVKADLPDGMTHWITYRFDIVEYSEGKPKIAVGTAQFSDVNKRLEARYLMEQRRKIVEDPSMLGYVISDITTNQVLERKNILNKMQFSEGVFNYDSVAEKFSHTIVSDTEREKWKKTHSIENIHALFREGTTAVELEMNVLCMDGIMRWVREVMNFVQHPETGEILLYNYFYDNHDQRVFGELMLAMADYGYEICGSLVAGIDQLSLIYAGSNTHEMAIVNYSSINETYCMNVVEEDAEMYRQKTSIENIRQETDNESNGFEITFRTMEDGELHYKRAQCYLYNKKEDTYLILRSDVTAAVKQETEKRMQLEEALAEARKANHAKSSFLSRMSHELRTPLNAINGYTSLIEDSINSEHIDTDAILHNISVTYKATDYLLSIISDILDIQSIEQGRTVIQKSATDIVSYMNNVADMIKNEADAKNIDFTFERKTNFNEYYMLDGPRFQQVLLNILHNAVKFTPDGGKIQMSGEAVSHDETKTSLKIVIADNGIGMSQEFVDNGLFHKFAQENDDITSPYDGCGTGLFLSSEMIKLMGGSITCKSEKDRGSEFTINITAEHVTKPRSRRKKRVRNDFTADLSGIRVLLCEDNQMNQDMERSILKKLKCEVDIAEDGLIGIEKYSQSPENYYSIVLMDIRMPNMDGLEAARRIRRSDRADAETIPVLAVSANAFEEDIQKSLEAGMNEHLAKPVDARVLYEKISKYCSVSENA